MSTKSSIQQSLNKLIDRKLTDQIAVCKIVAVNDGLVNVELDGLTYFDLPLNAVSELSNTFRQIPTIGSFALCLIRNNGGSQVLSVSDIDSFELKSKLPISIATDSEDLLSVLTDLISAIEKLTVTTAVGTSGTPINLAEFTVIKQRLTNLLK